MASQRGWKVIRPRPIEIPHSALLENHCKDQVDSAQSMGQGRHLEIEGY